MVDDYKSIKRLDVFSLIIYGAIGLIVLSAILLMVGVWEMGIKVIGIGLRI